MVSIANDGPPIAPGILPHLFELFFTTRSQREGKGMGLTIVRRILEKYYGQIVRADGVDEVFLFHTRFIVTLATDFRGRGVVL